MVRGVAVISIRLRRFAGDEGATRSRALTPAGIQ
jgi:hypothetical protein